MNSVIYAFSIPLVYGIDVQTGFRKGRGTRGQIVSMCWIIEKPREFQKNIYFCFINYTKAFDGVKVKVTQSCPTLRDPMRFSRQEYWSEYVWITTNYEKFLKRWEQHTTLPVY